jgi:uncharacterized membrane protein
MSILSIVIIIFILLEITNVITLYFVPDSRKANGLGVFNAWEKSKSDPEIHQLVRYLANWVAGTKLIFISLLIVILFTGDNTTKQITVIALILSILSFFWRLFPGIRNMDRNNQITPAGYSKTLGLMIGCFVTGFALALLFTVFFN